MLYLAKYEYLLLFLCKFIIFEYFIKFTLIFFFYFFLFINNVLHKIYIGKIK